MRNSKTRTMVLCALMMALVAVLTAVASVPLGIIPGAYVHPGDSLIFVAGYLLGPLCGAAVGGLGSALADMTLQAYLYVIPTLLVKALMGYLVGLAFRKNGLYGHWGRALALMLAAGLCMVAGYGVYEGFAFGWGLAITSLPFNLLQAGLSIVLGAAVIAMLEKVPWVNSLRASRAQRPR
nr:ECF transporter S component [Maliibacterium massiliense]